jgi:hypothetical protein
MKQSNGCDDLPIKLLKTTAKNAKVEYIIGTRMYEYFDQIS